MGKKADSLNYRLNLNFDSFNQRWGPVEWRAEIIGLTCDQNPTLGAFLWALGSVEEDSRQIAEKLRWSGALRNSCIPDFNNLWLAEESEHSRALLHMARCLGLSKPPPSHSTFRRDRRSIASAVTLRLASPMRMEMLGSYLALGAIQEHIAMTTYQFLERNAVLPNAVRVVCGRIAHQEARHMRFYYTGAQAVFDLYPRCVAFARHAALRFWRPPGVDLLGLPRWREIFAEAFADDRTRAQLAATDRVAERLFGVATPLMTSFMKAANLGTIDIDALPEVEARTIPILPLDAAGAGPAKADDRPA